MSSELETSALSLKQELTLAMQRLDIENSRKQMTKLVGDSKAVDFWNDNLTAQHKMKRISKLEKQTQPWLELQKDLTEVLELVRLNDESLSDDLQLQLNKISERFSQLKNLLKFSGKYDSNDVILSIYAGAGGTDAQDWASMLHRMYVRWADKHELDVSNIDISNGDEAGIKSVTIEIEGEYVYGKLKGEHGVHRLVRLSPFNSDNLRQTSFAKVEIMPKIDQPDDIHIDESDLRIDVYRSGGKGGQSVNTTDSAVRITHLPTGIAVAIQNERSQLQNKETAMTILRSKLIQLQLEQHTDQLSELKGPNEQAAWGNQIRSYILHPYKKVKDLRTKYESSDPDSVLDGAIDSFIEAYWTIN